jgi:hypothetical protein
MHSKKFKNCIKEIHHSPRNISVALESNPFENENENEIEIETDNSISDFELNQANSIEKFNENFSHLQELKKNNRTILIT